MVKKRRQVYTLRTCTVCGRGFRSARKHARTCSNACRKALSRVGQSAHGDHKNDRAESVTQVTFQQLDMLLEKYRAVVQEVTV